MNHILLSSSIFIAYLHLGYDMQMFSDNKIFKFTVAFDVIFYRREYEKRDKCDEVRSAL